MKTRILTILILAILFVNSFPVLSRDLTTIKRSGRIYIGFTKDDLGTINYDLAVEFAKYLNVELVPVEITWEEAFMKNGVRPEGLETNPSVIFNPDVFSKVDIICSTFTIMEWRRKIFDFAETLNSAELLMIDKKSPAVKSFADLAGKSVAFMAGTSFETHMAEINEGQKGAIRLIPLKTNEEVKELLNQGKVFGIILDADEALNLNVNSGLKYSIAMPITPMTKTAWAVEKGNNLQKEVENFFTTVESNEVLDKIFQNRFGIRYSSYVETINKIILLEKHNHDLNKILEEGKLVVGLRDRSFIYEKNGEKQFMHALAEEFADYLGISLEYLVVPYAERYWESEGGKIIRDSLYSPDWFGYIDLAVDAFAPSSWQSGKANFIPVIASAFSVIARKDKVITNDADLKNLKGVIPANSAYEEIARKLKLTNFIADEDSSIFEDVRSGKADFAITNDARFVLHDDPELEIKFSLGKTDICWALRKDQPMLAEQLRKFISNSQKGGLIKYLLDDPSRSTEAAIHKYYERYQNGQFPSVTYGADNGLPQEDIYTIFQDKLGYMWFGTCAGAVRYNGREMRSIGNSLELSDNTVRSIKQDSSGLIYLASAKGITVIDKDTVINQLFTDTNFHSIFIDHSDNKWFAGSSGIILLKKDGSHRLLNKEFRELPVTINNIEEDRKSGDIYFSTLNGIYRYSPAAEKIIKLTGNECYFLFIDSHRHPWLSTANGLFVGTMADLVSGNFEHRAVNLNIRLDLHNDIIRDIKNDKSGSVWLIFDTRIIQMTSNDRWSTIYDQNTGLKNNRILSALFDREDNLWIGYYGGLQRLSYTRGLRNFFPSSINSFVYSFQETPDGKLWIASNNGIFYWDNRLVNFSSSLGSHSGKAAGNSQKYVMGKMPGGNLLFVSSEGMYEVDPLRLKIKGNRTFDGMLESLDNVFISSKGEIALLTGINGVVYYMRDFRAPVITIRSKLSTNISQFIEKEGRIFGGNSFGVVELKGGQLRLAGETGYKIWSLCSTDSVIWAGTDYGLRRFTWEDFKNPEPLPLEENTVVKSICPAVNKNYLWLGTNHGFAYFNKESKKAEFFIDSKDGLSGDEITPAGLFTDRNNLLWAGTYNGVNNFNLRARASVLYPPACFIERVILNGREIDLKPGKSFRYNQNNFVFEISAISFTDEKSIEFEYYIRGMGNDYSSYNKGKEFKAYYNNLPPGKYEFIYKARGKNNIQSYSQKYLFTIQPAWFNTWIFRLSLIIATLIIIYLLYNARVKTIEAQKKKLEQQVKERTFELEVANVEIQAQRDLARSQRDRIGEQKKEITDSIYYAERIQRSLLPDELTLDHILPEHFILLKPRNIVSGDFYWIFEKGDSVFISAVDCTGHGVPGALMSMLGISFLNEIVITHEKTSPDDILNHLRDHIIKTLKQVGNEGESRDGMDIGMLMFNKARTTISFAGANNPLYFVRNGELKEIKGDKMPVGIYEKMLPFTNHTMDIQKGDAFYIFSDGYADQFGGPKARKFLYSNLKKLLLDIRNKPMKEQGKILDETIIKWQGHLEQVDDIVVIGLRF